MADDQQEINSEEARAARGAEVRSRVGERIKQWVRDKTPANSQVERHSFAALQKKALEGQSKPGVAAKVRSALEAGHVVVKDEAKAAKSKIVMKTLGIAATVGAFFDPEPISKAALATAATGITVAEKAADLKAMKEARIAQKVTTMPNQADAHGKIVERILQMGNPSY